MGERSLRFFEIVQKVKDRSENELYVSGLYATYWDKVRNRFQAFWDLKKTPIRNSKRRPAR